MGSHFISLPCMKQKDKTGSPYTFLHSSHICGGSRQQLMTIACPQARESLLTPVGLGVCLLITSRIAIIKHHYHHYRHRYCSMYCLNAQWSCMEAIYYNERINIMSKSTIPQKTHALYLRCDFYSSTRHLCELQCCAKIRSMKKKTVYPVTDHVSCLKAWDKRNVTCLILLYMNNVRRQGQMQYQE